MPEGDTIHRTAARLSAALTGKPLVRLSVPRARATVRVPRPGTEIFAVEAVGKHLLVRFGDGVTLRSHLRMTGSWQLYAAGEAWRRPAHLARATIEVEGWTAVCFAAPVVELEYDDTAIAHLGPDLTAPDPTPHAIDDAVARMDTIASPDDEIGVVLLDQRIACGVGNVFKSEVLFACGVDPFTSVARVSPPVRRQLIETAAAMLRANAASSGPRTTIRGAPPGTVAVYRRARLPCRRCGTPIRTRRQGEQARSTYWCPACQPPPDAGTTRLDKP